VPEAGAAGELVALDAGARCSGLDRAPCTRPGGESFLDLRHLNGAVAERQAGSSSGLMERRQRLNGDAHRQRPSRQVIGV
jgi:hypothetical protein